MSTDGGPAFPFQGVRGMTLRDWFAGQALAGLMAIPATGCTASEIASAAYDAADAMLRERDK